MRRDSGRSGNAPLHRMPIGESSRMNTFMNKRRIRKTPKLKAAKQNAGGIRAVWMSLACVVLLAGCDSRLSTSPPPAQGQQQSAREAQRTNTPPPTVAPAADQPPPPVAARVADADDAKRTTAARVGRDQPPANPPKQKPTDKPPARAPSSQAGGCGGKEPAGPPPTPAPHGPQPRWVCKQPSITAEPAWGGKSIDFVFEISNEGAGILRFRLRRG